jgi:hypothetical protein
MGRKRKPFIVGGQEVEINAPGLNVVRGEELYWCASRTVEGRLALSRGYKPVTVLIHATEELNTTTRDGLRALALRCQVLQKEMLDWLADPEGQTALIFDGTLDSLIRCYQQDPESGYGGVKANTQGDYDDSLTVLSNARGKRRLDRLNGQDFTKLFLELMQPAAQGEPPRIRRARGAIKLLRILCAYGSDLGIEICQKHFDTLERKRRSFRVPDDVSKAWRELKPKKVAMTFDHAQAIVRQALSRGTRRHRSIALGVAAQFEFTLRQIDVIGYFTRVKHTAVSKGAIVSRGLIWHPGLTFEAIASGVLDLTTSKNAVSSVFDVAEYPLFLEALATVPMDERAGPLVTNDNGLPMKQRYYDELYNEIATTAKIPPEVWNMRARHGGLTEGYEAIVTHPEASAAELQDLKYHGQHTSVRTTLNEYVKPGTGPSKRIARRRVEKRKRDQA